MASWFPNQADTAAAATASEGHLPVSTEAEAPAELTEEVLTRRRCARIRSVPCVYLKCPPERKRNEQFAMAALLGLDHHTHRRDEVLAMVNLHCPDLFQNQAALEELFVYGNAPGIEHIVSRMYTRIQWDCKLAVLGLARSAEIYRFLPSAIQVLDEVVEQLLSAGLGPCYLGRYAPRPFLSENAELILKCINKGFRSVDVPVELRRSKEFIIKALAVTPSVLQDCALDMISDKDILLAAAGQTHTADAMVFLEHTLKRFPGNPKKVLAPFAQDVKVKLDNHAAFYALLHGISVAGRNESSSHPLQLLHCGEETSVALKREIADFLGAPTKLSEYNNLKKAWDTSVSSYYNANVKPKSEKQGSDLEESARAAERKLYRTRRMSRQLLLVVRRDLSNGRVEGNGRRDYRRILHQIQMAIDVDDPNGEIPADLVDSDSEFEDLLDYGAIEIGLGLQED